MKTTRKVRRAENYGSKKNKKKKNFVDFVTDGDILGQANHFKKEGMSFLETLTEEQLVAILREADRLFHNDKTPFLTDNEYDIIKEYVQGKYPKNAFFLTIGAPVDVEKNKITLPYEMASMDKIKPDTGILNSWKQKFAGPYVLSCKLDGVSGMYSCEGSSPKLYTRGNGKVGQVITYLLPYLKKKMPVENGLVVRGEFIIPKKVFTDKYSSQFANPRNLVAGIVNRQTVDSKIDDVHFVVYEVIQPVLKPTEQMKLLREVGFEVVLEKTVDNHWLTNENLSELLMDWRKNYLYEIDGVIVTDDKIYDRKSGNPEHAFAFKMVLSDQIAEAKVVDVLWSPSKDGYLKPRVQIEPVSLGGVKIEYATGFNGAFIEANKIGVGALIQIVRSGDVIPHIRGVTVPSESGPKMPLVPYKWTENHVDIVLEDINSDLTVLEKNIASFFRGLEVEGLSGGNVSRLVAAGFNSVPIILAMKEEDFLKVPGFKKAMSEKLYRGIKEKVESAPLYKIMAVSNVFGRGFSDKKIELIMTEFPYVLTVEMSKEDKIKKLASVKGMASKTAEAFVEHIPLFLKFLNDCQLTSKLTASVAVDVPVNMDHPLYKKNIVLTGFRDKKLAEDLKKVGAISGSSVSKNTFLVLSKDLDEESAKILDAKKLGIPLMTLDEFNVKYFSNG